MSITTNEPTEQIKIEFLISAIEERQTIVHCSLWMSSNNGMRATPETFLIDKLNGKKYKILTALGIAFYPQWTRTYNEGYQNFTLIFEGLGGDCIMFDLIEESEDPSLFASFNILRNKTDVYNVRL